MTICDKCGRVFNDWSIMHCRHPAVNRLIGRNICYLCCCKCKYISVVPHGRICTYEKVEVAYDKSTSL